MNTKTSNKITYLYFLMSVMILGLHSIDMDMMDANRFALAFNHAIRILYNMGVSTFFFVSALLFFRSINNKRYLDVIKNKIVTLVIPYLCWNVICWPLKELKNVLTTGSISGISIYESLYKIVSSQWNPVLWFVRVLFLYFVIYPIVLWVVKHKVIFICFLVVNLAINIALGGGVGYSTMRYWLPIYMVGAYLGYWHKERIFEPHVVKFGVKGYWGLVFLQMALIALAMTGDLGLYICRMVSPLCFWGLADILAIEQKPKWWMRQAFYYYCAQLIFTGVAQNIYIKIFGISNISAIASNIILPILLLVILAVTAYVFRFVANPVWKVLTGGREKIPFRGENITNKTDTRVN